MASFSADKLDFPSVLFRHLDRISITISEIHSITFSNTGTTSILPIFKAQNLKAQVLLFETLLYPYLPADFYETTAKEQKQIKRSWGRNEWEKSIDASLALMGILMLELSSADLLPKESMDAEHMIDDSDGD